MLTLPSYEILNFNADSLVVSKCGVSRISSPPLLAVLAKLKSYKVISRVELEEILSEYGLNPIVAFGFLEKVIPIKESYDRLFFEGSVIAHDWDGCRDLEKLLKSEVNGNLEVCTINGLSRGQLAGKRNYIVIMCMNYNYECIKDVYFDLARVAPESAISVCYRAGNTYCISQPYMPVVGNPCHFCSVDRVINYEAYHRSENSWSKLLKFCMDKHIAVPSESLSALQRALIVGAVVKKVRWVAGNAEGWRYQDNLLQDTYIDLNGDFVKEVTTSHWYMCDCLRGQK
jgi:McbB family protein